MLLKQYLPDEDYSWQELEQLTGKKEDLYTWPLYGMLNLQEKGFEIIDIEDFDYHRFTKLGDEYLLERLGEEVGMDQIENSDIPYEINNAKLFLQSSENISQIPSIGDMKQLLANNYLIICNVNSDCLNGRDGYSGHFILVYHIDEERLYVHDPGPPAIPARILSYHEFTTAWAYPSEREQNLIAIRRS